MKNHPTLNFLVLCISIMLLVVTTLRDDILPGGETRDNAPINRMHAPEQDNTPGLSKSRINHILYGDATGGGHKFGTGAPCKSEFPASWNDTDIIDTVKTMAANDNLDWKQQDNGYYVAEQNASDGTRVRVVLDREGDDVITAYPVNTRRNACPAK